VEQTETVAESQLRTGKKTCMVRREICQVLSPGTMTLSVRDEFSGYDNHGRNGLLSISEDEANIAFCLLDASTGKFQLGQFAKEDNSGIDLRALLVFETPAELVYCPSRVSTKTLQILKMETKPLHTLVPSSSSTLPISIAEYFKNDSLPEALKSISVLENDALNHCLRVLKRALVDEELVTMKQFSRYRINNASTGSTGEFMRLDSQALKHLEILTNNQDGTSAGSLFEYLNRTKSKFGTRLLRDWVCRPLTNLNSLRKRQEQVTFLLSILHSSPAITELRKLLGSAPDLEKNLSKIHALGQKKKTTHPDSRAIIFSAVEVNKSKIDTFCQTIESIRNLRVCGEKVAQLLLLEPSNLFADICFGLTSQACLEGCKHFEQAFDAKQARKTGSIEPRPGVAPEFDSAQQAVDEAKRALQEYLAKIKKELGCSSLEYFLPSTGKNRYQIEVPETKQVPKDWQLSSKKKGTKRYLNPMVKQLITTLERAEEALASASTDVTRIVFNEFDKRRADWSSLVSACGELDCLLSLALVSGASECCLPTFLDDTHSPMLQIEQGIHPCVASALERSGKSTFIPNDVELSNREGQLMLLTGPNMGGKSTLLRQTCLLTLVAQIGCHVTAKSYCGTIVDAIFTRIGASDKILEGQSTFFVELSETATILNHSTKNSLVILDELGRGTSTFDGTAIAQSVVEKLVQVGCLTMFATHYHSLVNECKELKGKVSLGHMACDASNSQDQNDVMFLYKLTSGSSDRSYGLNVARLAKLPESVIQRAKERSMQFESDFDAHITKRLLEEMSICCQTGNVAKLRVLMARAQGLI
jgi:DNA mismatch repair protein MSH6